MDPIVLASYEDVAISLLNLASHKIISSLESISKTCPFWKLPAKQNQSPFTVDPFPAIIRVKFSCLWIHFPQDINIFYTSQKLSNQEKKRKVIDSINKHQSKKQKQVRID